jgi:type I restriction enzyme, S subunit
VKTQTTRDCPASRREPNFKQTDAGPIPHDWDVSSVGNEFAFQLGKMLDAAKNIGVPKTYVGNRAVQWGRVVLDEAGTVRMTPSDLQRFRLRRGDLLVCEGGEIGRAAIWDEPIPECYYQKALHRLRPRRGYSPYLMMCFLELWSLQDRLANFVTQTSIAHLPKDKFELVPLCRCLSHHLPSSVPLRRRCRMWMR